MSDIIHGDAMTVLKDRFADESVQCCITSPPYWGLRDYKVDGQLGLEATPELYVAKMVEVFREVRRVLKPDGTLWLNLGDSYSGANPPGRRDCGEGELRDGRAEPEGSFGTRTRTFRPGAWAKGEIDDRGQRNRDGVGGVTGLAPKNLVGIPWRVAFALQADGWYLRSDIIWAKPNPMPESVTDRPTKAHEYLFLMSKSERYYYDAGAIAETSIIGVLAGGTNPYNLVTQTGGQTTQNLGGSDGTRNKRTVWTIATQPYPDAHFATFPTKLVEPCVLAGCPVGGLVLDPFTGSGTVLAVAKQLGRQGVGIELNPAYITMAEARLMQEVLPLS